MSSLFKTRSAVSEGGDVYALDSRALGNRNMRNKNVSDYI